MPLVPAYYRRLVHTVQDFVQHAILCRASPSREVCQPSPTRFPFQLRFGCSTQTGSVGTRVAASPKFDVSDGSPADYRGSGRGSGRAVPFGAQNGSQPEPA